jgi:hypothetical protein
MALWEKVHDDVHHAIEGPRDVGDALALAQGDVAGAEIDGVASELGHARLEAHPGSEGRLLEDHGHGLVGQGVRIFVGAGLDLERRFEDLLDLFHGEVVKGYQVSSEHGSLLSQDL